MRISLLLLVSVLLSACASQPPIASQREPIDAVRLPAPDISLSIAGLGPCIDSDDRSLQLNSSQPVTVLVHGCFGSAGKFRSLAQVLAYQGQQTACFSYDDRASLMESSSELSQALTLLSEQMKSSEITVLGHSQGGLVSRKALIDEREDRVTANANIRLVTVSAPFAGIKVASACGNPFYRIASFGLIDLSCWAVSGDKWYEITDASNFIRQPGTLRSNISQHLKVATDETQICRRQDATGHCLEDDYVFSLAEQYFPPVDKAKGVRALIVKAGHAGVVGEMGKVPEALISVLQSEGVIRPVEPERISAFQRFLNQLYGS